MLVKSILGSRPVITIGPDDELAVAAQTMLWAGVRHLPVVRGTEVVGVLSERDLFRHHRDVGARVAARDPVSRAMRAPAVTIAADEPMVAAISLMLDRKIGCLPVVDGERLVGVLTTTDVLAHQLDAALERPATGLPPQITTVMRVAPAVATAETELMRSRS